ncbi:hypothetical protein [Peribacillus kribbensis]|uniref:hypothetical protein n=1 Tax=Peribacillus kribbensis TaxID=356658 RepID=UPI000416AE68|nr:hypothetical protein [Peribacillus kribbensis]
MGRVSGAASSFMNLSMLIGPVAGGMLAVWVGAGGVFIGAGVLLSMIGLAGLFIIKRKFVYKGKMKKPA